MWNMGCDNSKHILNSYVIPIPWNNIYQMNDTHRSSTGQHQTTASVSHNNYSNPVALGILTARGARKEQAVWRRSDKGQWIHLTIQYSPKGNYLFQTLWGSRMCLRRLLLVLYYFKEYSELQINLTSLYTMSTTTATAVDMYEPSYLDLISTTAGAVFVKRSVYCNSIPPHLNPSVSVVSLETNDALCRCASVIISQNWKAGNQTKLKNQ